MTEISFLNIEKECTKCHKSLPLSEFCKQQRGKNELRTQCRQCRNIYRKKWRMEHRAEHKEKIAAYDKKWRTEHKNKRNAYMKNYMKKMLTLHPEIYKKNLELQKAYRKTLNGKMTEARSKAKRKNSKSLVTLTTEDWNKILEIQKYRCAICKRRFSETLKPTRDHIIPLSKGGGLTFGNIMALCASCNSKKSTKLVDIRIGKKRTSQFALF